MEFWGVEVKPGKPLKVECEEDTLIHISQASLGDCKSKKGETVPLYVKVGDQKLVMGTLHSENIPQLSCDLVFEKEFELSHNWGKGSVYFVGYKSPNIEDGEGGEFFSDSEEEEEEEVGAEDPATITANGNAAKAKPVEVKKNAKPETADYDEDDSDFEDGMDVDGDDSDDEEDSEDEEETPTPKKPESNKKRANEAAPKSPVSAKKAKAAVTPQRTEEKKKGGHTATPHPAKKGGKTPATATQNPKSASQVSCGSCKKTFNSGNALESHTKAKHSAAK